MKKPPQVELNQLKQALAVLADDWRSTAAQFAKEVEGSPIDATKKYFAGCVTTYGEAAATLSGLVELVEKLPKDADRLDISHAAHRAAAVAFEVARSPRPADDKPTSEGGYDRTN